MYVERGSEWRRIIVCAKAPQLASAGGARKHTHSSSDHQNAAFRREGSVYEWGHLQIGPCHCSLPLLSWYQSPGNYTPFAINLNNLIWMELDFQTQSR